METKYHAPDITCSGCANTIRKRLQQVPGVEEVEVDVAAKNFTVRHAPTVSAQEMEVSLQEIGYPVTPSGNGHHHGHGERGHTHIVSQGDVPAGHVKDPVCGMIILPEEAAGTSERNGQTIFFLLTFLQEEIRR